MPSEEELVRTQLALIEAHLKSIDDKLASQVQIRHVNKDGICDAYVTVVNHDRQLNQWAPDIEKIDEHDKRINQWIGAFGAVAVICSFLGGLIAVIITKVWK